MKSNNKSYIISIDPGISGGLSVFEQETKKIVLFQKNPIQSDNKKSKYNLQEFYEIFSKYTPCKIASEFVHSMPGEGSTSSFRFGRSSGQIEGLAFGMQIPYTLVTPQKWKKYFTSNLISDEMLKLKEDLKVFTTKIKLIKTIKNKKERSETLKTETKIKNKISYHYKKIAKRLSREHASNLYPETQDMLKKTTYDGVADAILIGVYYMSTF